MNGSMIDHHEQDPVASALQKILRRLDALEARMSRAEDAVAGATPTPATPAVASPATPWAVPVKPVQANLDDLANLGRESVQGAPVAPEAMAPSPQSLGYGAARHGAVGPPVTASTPPRRRTP